VNAIHQNASGSPGGGVDIFSGDNASNMTVSETVLNNPELISLMGALPDGTEIAAAIFALHTAPIESENGMTIEGFYSTVIGELGARSRSAQQLEESSVRVLQGFEERLESVRGVNVDEEMANMLVVQSSYQAASRVIVMVDEMMQSILNMV
jgi:flagellar hook-associated protein 1 FlgK